MTDTLLTDKTIRTYARLITTVTDATLEVLLRETYERDMREEYDIAWRESLKRPCAPNLAMAVVDRLEQKGTP